MAMPMPIVTILPLEVRAHVIDNYYLWCVHRLPCRCIPIYFASNYSISAYVICAMEHRRPQMTVESFHWKLNDEARKKRQTSKRGKHNVHTYRLVILNGHFRYTACSCAISIAFITNFICCDAAMLR